MIVLETITHETIWGGPRIARFANVASQRIGHLYSVYCREGISNRVLNGLWKGKTLNDIFPLWKQEFQMGEYDFFPLTLALTEANEHLSIQVHPDDAAVQTLEHLARGKRESWYFLEAPEAGYIMNGCTCRSEAEKDAMLRAEKYLEMTDKLPISVGDYVFVYPGTLHSITAGSLVYEIEEGADFTYRFYDYDRIDSQGNRRELHIEKAAKALDITRKSIVKHYPESGEIEEETYSTKRISKASQYENVTQTLECFTLVQGSAVCDGVKITPGMTVMLWPKECIKDAEIKLAFVAKLRGNTL